MSRAGSGINPRDCPPREVVAGGEVLLPTPAPTSTTTCTRDGVTVDGSTPTAQPPAQQSKMLFSDLYKNPKSPLSKLRHSLPHAVPILPAGLDEDLVSRDKVKQKEAVKRFLAERVRNDWEFNWPPQPQTQQSTTRNVEQSQPPDVKSALSEGASAEPVRISSEEAEPSYGVDSATVSVAVDAAPVSVPGPNLEADPLPASPPPGTEVTPKDPGEEADLESDAESVYSTVSEDALHYRARADWTSDLSDDDVQPSKPILSPFRFDTPDSVGAEVQSAVQARRARRRREVRDESRWNNGVACYNARRDAWTGARTVRVKPRAVALTSPTSPISPRRLFWRTHSRTESATSSSTGAPLTAVLSAPAATTTTTGAHPSSNPLSPTTTRASDHSSTPSSSEDAPPCARQLSSTSTTAPTPSSSYPVETLLPVPPPLIPPQNPMRASISPQIYPSLYDKVVVHSLQPSCPINLSDMVASCVAGWKRDGEWPPRSAPLPQPSVVAVRRKKSEATAGIQGGQQQHGRKGSAAGGGIAGRRMSFGFLGRDKRADSEVVVPAGNEKEEVEGAGKGIRRSLQKVFSGLGHHQTGAGEQHVAGKETAVMYAV